MKCRSLTLISSSNEAVPTGLVDAVSQHWPANQRPPICAKTLNQVLNDQSFLDSCCLVWVFLNGDPTNSLQALLGLLHDRHVPVLLTRAHETQPIAEQFQDQVLIGPPDASPMALCAVLRTLWLQSVDLRELQTEVSILRAHQNGLCDQIDRIDEELRLAAQLQREFLPNDLPKVDNLEIHALYRPAGYLSGDIYDVMRLDERHIGFFIADAVGHGVPAALMTMYIKRSLRMKKIDPTVDAGYYLVPPHEALAKLNCDIMDQQSERIRTATACYAILNFSTLELTIARAGHPFPLVLRSDGSTEFIDPSGAMLGIFAGEEFELAHIKLHAGDRLLLYSDGFEMAFPGEEPSDTEPSRAHIDAFRDLANGSLAVAMQRLSSQLDRQLGSLNQADDMTALLLGVGSDDPRFACESSVQSASFQI